MKISEALSQIISLQKQCEVIKKNIKKLSETKSSDNIEAVKKHLENYEKLIEQILDLRIKVQKANLKTEVPIEIGGIIYKRTIAEWLQRKKDLASLEYEAYACAKNIFEQDEINKKLNELADEPFIIASSLIVANTLNDLED